MTAASDPMGKEAVMFATRAIPLALAMATALVFACDSGNGPNGSEGLDEDKSLGLSVSPGILNVIAGTGGSGTVRVTRGAALADPIQLSASGLPTGVTVAFAPEVLVGDVLEAEMIVAVAATASPGSHAIAVRATAASATAVSRTFTLEVIASTADGFSVGPAGGALTVGPDGEPATVTLTISRHGPFTGAVSLELLNVPAGLVASVSPATTVGNTATLSVSAPVGAAPGIYAFDLLAKGEGLPGSVRYRWSVTITTPPPLSALNLTFDPASLTVVAGGSSATTTLNIQRVNFTGPVACWEEAGRLPSPNDLDLKLSADHVDTASSMTMTVQAPVTMVPGVYEAGAFCWATDLGSPMRLEWMTVTVIAAP